MECDKSAPHGPFTTLHGVLEKLGWCCLRPPFVMDHTGWQHNFCYVDGALLLRRIREAWALVVSAGVKHKSMAGLYGIELNLTLSHIQRLAPVERARVLALNSGTFFPPSQKAKFDKNVESNCPTCGCRNDRKHWLHCPAYVKLHSDFPEEWRTQVSGLPDCFVYHTLIPYQAQLHVLEEFHATIDCTWTDHDSYELAEGVQHLFTDGSCYDGRICYLARSAWAVIHSGTGMIIAARHLAGPRQCIDRAELSALVSATAWGRQVERQICVWMDSLSTVRLAHRILSQRSLCGVESNRDLWQQFLQVILAWDVSMISVRWTPAHVDPDTTTDAGEDWLLHWNSRADFVATHTNAQREPWYLAQLQTITEQLETWNRRTRLLRAFYLAVGEETGKRGNKGPTSAAPILIEDDHEIQIGISEYLPLNWKQMIEQQNGRIPNWFLQRLMERLVTWDETDGNLMLLTDIEFTTLLCQDQNFCFPVWDSIHQQWIPRTYHCNFERPTLASLVGWVNKGLILFADLFGCQQLLVSGISKEAQGIYRNSRGLYMRVPTDELDSMFVQLRSLVARRPFRKACDLARPLAM